MALIKNILSVYCFYKMPLFKKNVNEILNMNIMIFLK